METFPTSGVDVSLSPSPEEVFAAGRTTTLPPLTVSTLPGSHVLESSVNATTVLLVRSAPNNVS